MFGFSFVNCSASFGNVLASSPMPHTLSVTFSFSLPPPLPAPVLPSVLLPFAPQPASNPAPRATVVIIANVFFILQTPLEMSFDHAHYPFLPRSLVFQP